MNKQELSATANAMVAGNKGLLAADESTGTIGKRFDSIGVENVEENRRDYREMMFRSEGIGDYISGVILFDETLRQNAVDGTPLSKILQDAGVIPGIKVDAGAKELPGRPAEKITEGLDGLPGRVAEYYGLGARFAKWRAVIDIADGIPSRYAIHTNAHALARYAKICQEGGLCPIVEPEVLMDGDHDIDRCQEVTEEVLYAVYNELHLQEVYLEGTILKPNMVIAGKKCATQASGEDVAAKTVETLKRCVPTAVPGIMFLSGGQSEEEATVHLDLMNAMGDLPWALSFSYGRALQQSALQAWKGDNANSAAAQAAFIERASANSRACAGTYSKAA